jgi:hypothetical protein
VTDIHRQYGDHLYTKTDCDGAMAQFAKTVGWTHPSYAIRKVRYDCFIVIYIIIMNETTFLGAYGSWTHSVSTISSHISRNSIPSVSPTRIIPPSLTPTLNLKTSPASTPSSRPNHTGNPPTLTVATTAWTNCRLIWIRLWCVGRRAISSMPVIWRRNTSATRIQINDARTC